MRWLARANEARLVLGGILVAFLALELVLIGQKVGDVRLEPNLPPWMSPTEEYIAVTFPVVAWPEPEPGDERACRVLGEVAAVLREWRSLSAFQNHMSLEEHLRRVTVTEVDTDGRIVDVRSTLRMGAFEFDVGQDTIRVLSRPHESLRVEATNYWSYFTWDAISPLPPEWPLHFRNEAELMAAVLPHAPKRGEAWVHYGMFKGAPIAVSVKPYQFGRIDMLDGREHKRGYTHPDLIHQSRPVLSCPGVATKRLRAHRHFEFDRF